MNTNIPVTVLVDMDEVLVKWGAGFTRAFKRRNPGVDFIPGEERKTFDMFLDEERDIHQLIRDTMDEPGLYLDMDPVPGAAVALNEMVESGIDVVICSSPWLSNPTCADDKFAWLEKYIGPGWADRAILTKDKTRVRGDWLIDDRPDITGDQIPSWKQIVFTASHNLNLISEYRMDHWSQWRDFVPVPELQAA